MSDEENFIKPHSEKQQDIIFSESKDTVAVTGTQFGKSQAGALWMKIQTHFELGMEKGSIGIRSNVPLFKSKHIFVPLNCAAQVIHIEHWMRIAF
jgi:hypothetical protein